MNSRLFLITVFVGFSSIVFGQQSLNLDNWKWLVGDWTAVGTTGSGQGSSSFSLYPDLNGKVLVRKNHAEYPASNNNLGTIHDDLMIIYPSTPTTQDKAIYFDNEGHVINYLITFTDKTIVFVSDLVPNMPVFRLTYTSVDPQTVAINFEMAQDGEHFSTYVSGTCKKKQ